MVKDVIKKAAPNATNANLDKYVPFLTELMPKYGIDTPLRQRHFLAQLLHESGSFSAVRENLNYSVDGLMKTFPKYFATRAIAEQYARKPSKIANCVYANRMGNGPQESGDGWRYRGGGLIQTTGRTNYELTGKGIGIPLVQKPELITEPKTAVESACWFWRSRGLNILADLDDIVAVTKRINGGVNGLDDRKKFYSKLQIS
jgi:putative chitinase